MRRVGKVVTGILDGRHDAVLAFLDRPFGKADGGELRQPLGDVDLDLHGIGVDTERRPGQYLGEHGSLLMS